MTTSAHRAAPSDGRAALSALVLYAGACLLALLFIGVVVSSGSVTTGQHVRPTPTPGVQLPAAPAPGR
jgi:hypothetical protein